MPLKPTYPLRTPATGAPKPDRPDFFRTGYGKTTWNPKGIHLGQDLSIAVGTPIQSVYGGEVTMCRRFGDLGLVVAHTDVFNREWWYAHCDSFAPNIEVGQTIKKATLLGTVGMTGNTDGPHVHIALLAKPLAGKKWGAVPYLDPYPELLEAWKDLRRT